MLDRMTRPIQALLMALRFKVPFSYAYEILKLQSQLEAGQITERQYMQAGQRLGELHPEDFKRLRSLFVGQEPKQ